MVGMSFIVSVKSSFYLFSVSGVFYIFFLKLSFFLLFFFLPWVIKFLTGEILHLKGVGVVCLGSE